MLVWSGIYAFVSDISMCMYKYMTAVSDPIPTTGIGLSLDYILFYELLKNTDPLLIFLKNFFIFFFL